MDLIGLHFKVAGSRLQVQFLCNGKAKTKLGILAFLYSGEFVKNPNAQQRFKCSLLEACNYVT